MWALVLLFLLPVIFLGSWIAAPFLYLLGGSIRFAHNLHSQFGTLGDGGFFILLIVLVVFCGKSKWFFWLGLLPVMLLACYLSGW